MCQHMLQYIVIIGAIIQLIGTIVYIKEMIYGRVKPNRVTRLMRAIAPLIGTVAAISDGVRRAILPIFVAGFWPLLVFITSLFNPRAYRKLGKFDYICGAFSILALILRRATQEPLLAIIFSIISDFFAAIPTIIKSWDHPESESIATYSTGLLSASTAFFAMQTYSISEIIFPIYIISINTFLIVVLSKKQIKEVIRRFIET